MPHGRAHLDAAIVSNSRPKSPRLPFAHAYKVQQKQLMLAGKGQICGQECQSYCRFLLIVCGRGFVRRRDSSAVGMGILFPEDMWV